MALFVDVKYARLIGQRLELFKVKKSSPFVANFRCYVCGDSKRDKFKTRGYFYTKSQKVLYSCHNCGASKHVSTVLKELDLQLFNDYKLERIQADRSSNTDISIVQQPRAIFSYSDALKGLKKISQLDPDHPAKKYIEKRKIPSSTHFKLYYAPRFKAHVNSLIPEKFEDVEKDEPRLILPFVNVKGQVYGFQGRAFHDKSIRYITIMLDENQPKVFGLDSIDPTKLVNVVEGPIDSLFLDNCVAMAGADARTTDICDDPANIRIIYDNEPRNDQIVKKIAKAIEDGYNVFLWPDGESAKDINDFVKQTNMDRPTLMRYLEANTYRGLRAMARFSQWSKCKI
jgi:transcription elongation factor Elf1